MWTQGRVDSGNCKLRDVLTRELVDSEMCGFGDLWTQGCVDLWTRGGLWTRGRVD